MTDPIRDELARVLHGAFSRADVLEYLNCPSDIAETLADAALAFIDQHYIPRASLESAVDALETLIVAVDFEVPPIRDGVEPERRLDILARCASEARAVLAAIGENP